MRDEGRGGYCVVARVHKSGFGVGEVDLPRDGVTLSFVGKEFYTYLGKCSRCLQREGNSRKHIYYLECLSYLTISKKGCFNCDAPCYILIYYIRQINKLKTRYHRPSPPPGVFIISRKGKIRF